MAFSPGATAAPLPMGGPGCLEQMAGPLPIVPAAPAPLVLPGPLAPVVPVVPPVPIVPPVPVVPPVVPVAGAAPIAAPITTMAGGAGGKGAPVIPAEPVSAPVVLPGPIPVAEPEPVKSVLVGVVAPEAAPVCAGAGH